MYIILYKVNLRVDVKLCFAITVAACKIRNCDITVYEADEFCVRKTDQYCACNIKDDTFTLIIIHMGIPLRLPLFSSRTVLGQARTSLNRISFSCSMQ